MRTQSNLKRIISMLAATVTVAAICASACACRDNSTPEETTLPAETAAPAEDTLPFTPPPSPPPPKVLFYPAIPGDGSRVVDAAQKESWEEPLAKLLSNVLIGYGEGGEYLGYKASVDENAPAIQFPFSCGLLDVTADGTPELLVFPLGYGGSSGCAYFLIYDIFTGQEIGHLDGGHDKSWCYYYDTEAGECRLYGQFSWRIGWAGRERFIQRVVCLDTPQPYSSETYLMTSHGIDLVEVEGGLDEVYSSTDYYLNGERVSLDDYYEEYDSFTATCVRLPDTALYLAYWFELTEEEDSYPEKGRKMAYALTHSEQVFLLPPTEGEP